MSYNTSFFGGGSGGGGGVTTFTALTDTPASYSGQAGKVVKVNSAENALEFVDGAGGATPIDSAYENVAAMVAATDISNGDTIATYGYYDLSDGGQMVYTVTNTDLSGDVDDGSVIALANSLYAQAQFPPYYRPEMWGAKGDGLTTSASTNSTAFQAMWDYIGLSADNVRTVIYSGGLYYQDETVTAFPYTAATNEWKVEGNFSTIRSTGHSGSSSTSMSIGTGSKTFTYSVDSSVSKIQVGDTVKISANLSLQNWMKGDVTAFSGTSMTVNVTETNFHQVNVFDGENTFNATTGSQTLQFNNHTFLNGQTLSIEYSKGGTRYLQADATITSVASNSFTYNVTAVNTNPANQTASNTLELTTGLAFVTVSNTFLLPVGVRVRIEQDASNYMEGVLVYREDGTKLRVEVDNVVGSGSYSGMTFSVIGYTHFTVIADGLTHNSWRVGGGITLLKRQCPDQATADSWIGNRFDINNLKLLGAASWACDTGLRFDVSYGSSVSDCYFGNCEYGFEGRFNLMSTWQDIFFQNNWVGMYAGYGDWTGADSANSQSNVCTLTNTRGHGQPYAGTFTNFWISGSNSFHFINHISEGGAAAHGIYFEGTGNNVRTLVIDEAHVEVTHFRSFCANTNNGQYITFNKVYPQYRNIFGENPSGNQKSTYIMDFVYWPTAGGYTSLYGKDASIKIDTSGVSASPKIFDDLYTAYKYFWEGDIPTFSYDGYALTNRWETRFASLELTSNVNSSSLTFDSPSNVGTFIANARTFRVGTTDTGYSFIRTTNSGLEIATGNNSVDMSFLHNALYTAGFRFIIPATGDNRKLKIYRTISGTDTLQYRLPSESGSDGQVMKIDSSLNVDFNWVDFLELGDVTDSSYTGLAGAIPTVNSGETGIELIPPAATAGEVLKSTGTTSTYGNIFGQIVSLLYNTTTAAITLPTGGLRPIASLQLNFKATSTSMLIEMQCYITVASGESVTSGLSNNPTSYVDVGTTAVALAINGSGGSHDISMSITKTWYVSGLTVGTSYSWYPSFESTGGTSILRVGVGVSPFVMKAIHGAA